MKNGHSVPKDFTRVLIQWSSSDTVKVKYCTGVQIFIDSIKSKNLLNWLTYELYISFEFELELNCKYGMAVEFLGLILFLSSFCFSADPNIAALKTFNFMVGTTYKYILNIDIAVIKLS